MVDIRMPFDEKRNIVAGAIKDCGVSIVEPGSALPMRKLIKGIINGSIVINTSRGDYDIAEGWSDEFAPGKTVAETQRNAHEASQSFLDKTSDVPSDPTASPSFDIVDAENLAASISASQAAIEGVSANVGEAAAQIQEASSSKPEDLPDGSRASGGEAA